MVPLSWLSNGGTYTALGEAIGTPCACVSSAALPPTVQQRLLEAQ